MHLPFHLAGELLRAAHATESGTAVKETTCERCGFEYVYQLRRSAQGQATSFLVEDHLAAAARARDRLEKVLGHSCDPVPCPACGWYQGPMVRRARQLRHRWMRSSALVLLPVSAILLAVATVNDNLSADPSTPPSLALLLLSLAGSGFVLAVALPLARWLLSRLYDPNAEDEETRKQRGRARAVNRAAYRAGVAVPPPPPEE